MNIFTMIMLSGCVFAGTKSGTLISCNDGDTCKVKTSGKIIKVRLNGIDAPEKGHPGALNSKKFLINLISNKALDLNCIRRSYDRDVCTIFIGETDVQKEMVKSGNAIDVPKYSKGKYKIDQDYAKNNNLGIWKLKNIKSPYCQRKPKNAVCNFDPMFQP